MTKELLNYVKQLSLSDWKSLSDKGLKTQEEVGELAKAILPYVNAFATTHRFVLKENILEECVDTILCALSIAYGLDFSNGDIDAMMMRKLKKWAILQEEGGVSLHAIPFEIHVTVDIKGVTSFVKMCESIGVKATLLELYDINGKMIQQDVMSSSVHFGDNSSVLAEMHRISSELKAGGITVLREKIETIMQHPAAPTFKNGRVMRENNYFETHIEVMGDKATIQSAASSLQLYVSCNKNKIDNGIYSLTCRSTNKREIHQEKVTYILDTLTKSGIEVVDTLTEFAIHDTNTKLDEKWVYV